MFMNPVQDRLHLCRRWPLHGMRQPTAALVTDTRLRLAVNGIATRDIIFRGSTPHFRPCALKLQEVFFRVWYFGPRSSSFSKRHEDFTQWNISIKR